MPLFKSHSPPPTNEAPARSDTQTRRNGFFGRRNSSDESSLGRANSTRTAETSQSNSTSRSGFLSHFKTQGFPHNDPTIMAAREKVSTAEEAEKAADRALQAARKHVQEAREHVKFLEKEAEDDARRAKMKQAEAKNVSKAAGALGRHG
ncbi:hypothetical protein K435DRAFT_809847 [Dendrothele bispora CBS 962.96]|uniref:Uncharacterized protein n=1 Tax=Dendrothele bispora (strain CBS 962.96) TaxID=1314807 RepID=A0A4S8KWW0_DENBC|nr:hypothetical protein K435DRAFT_809847 [Dendrothele bispora CBS 962.96]